MSAFQQRVARTKHALMADAPDARERVAKIRGETINHCDSLYLAGMLALGDRQFARARKFIDQAYEVRLWVDDRVYLPRSVELLGAASRAEPDWAWPRYQLARERWRCIGASVTSAVKLLSESTGRTPSFVQVGANDGRSGDPLFGLIKNGQLKGLLIEPQPEPFEKLREHYASIEGLAFENAAVTEEPGIVKMLTATARTTIGSLVPERGLLSRHDGEMKTVDVVGKPFAQMLDEHGISTFDVLQIDTEGFDYHVLKQVDLEAHGIQVVNMEYYHLPIAERVEVVKLLEAAGFAFTCSYMDLFAVRQGSFLADAFCFTDMLSPAVLA